MELQTYKREAQKGLLTIAVLQLLANRKLYAGEIIEALSTTEFKLQEGTLYPLLSRLKREGLLGHEWVESKSGPPRKYYSLSPAGRAARSQLIESVRDSLASLEKLLTESA